MGPVVGSSGPLSLEAGKRFLETAMRFFVDVATVGPKEAIANLSKSFFAEIAPELKATLQQANSPRPGLARKGP